ncbi:hypothetical protein PILCRDRAFT_117286 [Piloderma croceum F 1598]|uniref:RING-type domain-containing protein n=1 Tax=Piloderma croceum (strain F 1598) TaxID=765440 RepID=A0A0C3C0A8_PILCF|nr:hypothetical protein PILCRDRAFT_117286 [Piloderma croceum F 1598]
MSSGTLSSSPGPSTLQQNSKRALSSHSRDAEDRLAKKSRTTSEEPSLTIRESSANTNSTAKDKKKRQRKKKRKVSVVVIEDGHARIKDSSHRGVSGALVSLTHPSPVKLGESSRSQSKSTVLANDERDVEEAVHGSKDKGKGKAVEPDEPNTPSAEQEIARLIKELAFKNELIEKHQTTLTQTQQSITCQVCLELMYNPYALSPCGHLACYDCLLGWFKATPEDQPDPPPVLVRKKTCPHCRAAITDRPVQVWGVKSIVSCFAKSGLLQGSFLSADEAAEASGNGAVVGEGKDPWDGIFRRKQRGGRGATRERLNDFDLQRDIFDGSEDERGAGILDDEDGGVYRCYDCLHEIWDGLCSNCGRAYPNFDGDEDDGDFYLESDEDDFGDDGDDVGLRWMAQAHLDFHHALGFDDHQQPPQQHEEEGPHDDIQARLIDIEAERAADEGREPDFRAELPFVGSEGDDDDDDDGEEEEYEGSFIDDENDVGIPARHLVASSLPPLLRRSRTEIIELSSGSDDDEFPAHRSRRPLSASASARRGGGGRGRGRASSSPIEVSDDEDEVQEAYWR